MTLNWSNPFFTKGEDDSELSSLNLENIFPKPKKNLFAELTPLNPINLKKDEEPIWMRHIQLPDNQGIIIRPKFGFNNFARAQEEDQADIEGNSIYDWIEEVRKRREESQTNSEENRVHLEESQVRTIQEMVRDSKRKEEVIKINEGPIIRKKVNLSLTLEEEKAIRKIIEGTNLSSTLFCDSKDLLVFKNSKLYVLGEITSSNKETIEILGKKYALRDFLTLEKIEDMCLEENLGNLKNIEKKVIEVFSGKKEIGERKTKLEKFLLEDFLPLYDPSFNKPKEINLEEIGFSLNISSTDILENILKNEGNNSFIIYSGNIYSLNETGRFPFGKERGDTKKLDEEYQRRLKEKIFEVVKEGIEKTPRKITEERKIPAKIKSLTIEKGDENNYVLSHQVNPFIINTKKNPNGFFYFEGTKIFLDLYSENGKVAYNERTCIREYWKHPFVHNGEGAICYGEGNSAEYRKIEWELKNKGSSNKEIAESIFKLFGIVEDLLKTGYNSKNNNSVYHSAESCCSKILNYSKSKEMEKKGVSLFIER
jgi:hypothetical protein